MTKMRKLAALAAIAALAGATAPAAFAGVVPGKVKCNAGNGNSSESTPATDCDPGNSGGHNNGGD